MKLKQLNESHKLKEFDANTNLISKNLIEAAQQLAENEIVDNRTIKNEFSKKCNNHLSLAYDAKIIDASLSQKYSKDNTMEFVVKIKISNKIDLSIKVFSDGFIKFGGGTLLSAADLIEYPNYIKFVSSFM